MDEFRKNKLKESILVQSRLGNEEAEELAIYLESRTDWGVEFDYNNIVNKHLEKAGMLRNQVQKSCKIRSGTTVNKRK